MMSSGNALHKDLANLVSRIEQAEKHRVASDPYRLSFHLMPPVGWMNDPNGLCYCNGWYHVFYQYSPFDPTGGVKCWGHYRSRDWLHWEQLPVMLYPDQPWSVHGAYSGSALVEDDTLYLYYTGNVKYMGAYNYITNGRNNSTALAVSRDGICICSNELLMENADYPAGLSCHVRDPKVWAQDGRYYMAQGARTLQDQGEIRIWESTDKRHWKPINTITTPEPFGYMWECPDLFELEGQWFLLCSPQGVAQQGHRYQNVYTSGYFPLYGDFRGDCTLGDYQEWDSGFDFYAPQTFGDGQRRYLIGWMGMPDAPYTNPTVAYGWQHSTTVPCELKNDQGMLRRVPIDEWKQLRQNPIPASQATVFDLTCRTMPTGRLTIRESAMLEWENGQLRLSLTADSGAGRLVRYLDTDTIQELRLLADTSSLEIFVNGGAQVLSTRYYPAADKHGVTATGVDEMTIWQMGALSYATPDISDTPNAPIGLAGLS